jgi:hypothetical protein
MEQYVESTELEELPERDVTKAQFREAAKRSGWQQKTIDLFLAPPARVLDHVKVAGERLRVTDW